MKRQQQLDELVSERDDAVTRHGISLKVDKEMVNRRVADLQLVTDSRLGLDQGLRKVLLEPPPVPAWEKPAVPSLVSHWQTISGQHLDPPARQHSKMILSYRKEFPNAQRRPNTPSTPQWGGCVQPGVNSGIRMAS